MILSEKNLGYRHEICMADDASTDGTWEWMKEIAEKDQNVKIHRNAGPDRLGHTILYDTLINDYATNDIVMIYHADMYMPDMDTEVLKHIKPGGGIGYKNRTTTTSKRARESIDGLWY